MAHRCHTAREDRLIASLAAFIVFSETMKARAHERGFQVRSIPKYPTGVLSEQCLYQQGTTFSLNPERQPRALSVVYIYLGSHLHSLSNHCRFLILSTGALVNLCLVRSCVFVYVCVRVYIHLCVLCILGKYTVWFLEALSYPFLCPSVLTSLSPPLSLLISFCFKLILSDIRIAAPAYFFLLGVHFFSPFTLMLKWISSKQHIDGLFLNPSLSISFDWWLEANNI